MDSAVHVVTLATPDLDVSRRFYCQGLGWPPLLDEPGEILFFQIGPGVVLGFFDAASFDRDLGRTGASEVSGVTLAHNVIGQREVHEVAERMVIAGGTLLTPPTDGEFGGIFHAHVTDPHGVIWEIAHNPGWRVDPDGRVHLG